MKIGVYFLFYVAMILELMIFIVEKEDAEQALLKENENLISSYLTQLSKPLKLAGPSDVMVNPRDKEQVVFSVSPIMQSQEQDSLHFVNPKGAFWKILPDTSLMGVVRLEVDGNKLPDNAKRDVVLECYTTRAAPSGLPSDVRDTVVTRLKKILGDNVRVRSNQFTVSVRRGGVVVHADLGQKKSND
jgi:hypothetical protein